MSEDNWKKPRKWNEMARAAGEQHLVFTNSWADVLERRDDLVPHRARLCQLVEETPNLIWLFLTKRPENQDLLPAHWTDGTRTPPNVWFGTTAENQEWFDIRVQALARARWAARRFISFEPILGKIRVDYALKVCVNCHSVDARPGHDWVPTDPRKYWWTPQSLVAAGWDRPFDWAIIGGESGAHRTELDMDVAWDLARQCDAAGIAVYVKQDSAPGPGERGRFSDEMWARKAFPDHPLPAIKTL